jgi:DNA-binding GntR family transcriptional regulator
VKKFSVKEVMEINTVQELLEVPTALLALENRTEDDLAELRSNLDKCDRSLSEGDLTTYSLESLHFHQLLYESSKNVALSQILQNVREKLIIKSRINFLNMERIRLNLEDHRRIYECLVRQDRDRMGGLIRRHIAEAHENFLRIIKDRPELLYVSI